MINLKRTIENEKGSALTFTIMVFAVLMIFATFLVSFMSSENKMSLQHQRKIQAYYVARSGAVAVDRAIKKMDSNVIIKLSSALKNGKIVTVDKIFFDKDFAAVTLLKIGKDIHIESTGYVNGVNKTVIKVLENTEDGDVQLDMSIYAHNELSIPTKHSPTIEKPVVVPQGVTVNLPNTDGKSVINEIRHYPILDSSKMDRLIEKKIARTIVTETQADTKTINNSTVFKSTEVVTFDNNTVNTENGPVDIVVEKLKITGNKGLKITPKGGNKVRIFVKDTITFEGANLTINDGGDSNQLEIYYYGSDLMKITNHAQANTLINANIYVKKADIQINKVRMEGMLYAPGSNIQTTKEANSPAFVKGIIGKEVLIDKSITISKPKLGAKIPPDELLEEPIDPVLRGGSETGGHLSYEEEYFK